MVPCKKKPKSITCICLPVCGSTCSLGCEEDATEILPASVVFKDNDSFTNEYGVFLEEDDFEVWLCSNCRDSFR